MQTRDRNTPSPQRKPPEGMPTQVPPRKPAQAQPVTGEPLPAQKPITDEPEAVAPAKWKKTVRRIAAVLGLILSLALVYVFLLMGEPEEDGQLTQQNSAQEEVIRVPIAATQVDGNTDINPLAVNFGMPVLALQGGDLTLQKATLFDTAFRGDYARRLTLAYAFPTGETLTLVSVRPTAAVSLLSGDRYSLNLAQLYSIAGMDAVRMDSDSTVLVLARGLDAAYAVVCPKSKADNLSALLKQASLMQPATP